MTTARRRPGSLGVALAVVVLSCTNHLDGAYGWIASPVKGANPTTPSTILHAGAIPPDDTPYVKPEERVNIWPKTYVGNEARWGQFKPGIKKENFAIQDVLKDELKVPWPAFQEWPWHFR